MVMHHTEAMSHSTENKPQPQDESRDRPLWLNVPRQNLAYSMDCLIPGLYLWFGRRSICIGGCEAEPDYPGTVHSFAGLALVLPNYQIWTTYQGDYDPR
jgi:hypothetical protein